MLHTNLASYTFFSNISELDSREKLLFRATKFFSPQRNWSLREVTKPKVVSPYAPTKSGVVNSLYMIC